MRNKVLLFTLLLGMALPADAGLPDVYSGAEIKGRILDAKTGEAIEGAVIVASWQIFEPSFFHKGADAILHAGEAVSGKDGTYTVPSWDSIPRPWGWEMEGGQDPVLYIFKPGYESEVKGNAKWRTEIQTGPPFNARSASVRRSVHDGKDIALYTLGTKPRKQYGKDPSVKPSPIEERTIKRFKRYLGSIVFSSKNREETRKNIRRALVLADKEAKRILGGKHYWGSGIGAFLKREKANSQ